MKRLHWLTIVAAVLAAITFHLKHSGGTVASGTAPRDWMQKQTDTGIPPADRRPADQTFLTFPEWYLVYGPEEQANFFATETSTRFPFMNQVQSLWSSYGIVYDQIRDTFEFNTGYHVMILVISVSSTAEFGLKAWYETIVGRLTDTTGGMTQEDRFNAAFTRDYVEFIKVRPWYEYDFTSQLKRLWTETDATGPHLLRKWDRKYILTSELLVKIGYGWLIGLGTATAYETAKPNTVVEVTDLPSGFQAPDVEVVSYNAGGISTLSVPRYAAFRLSAHELATAGAKFHTIAGNQSALLMTLVVPSDWSPDAGRNYVELFRQEIHTAAGPPIKRVALVTRVSALSDVLSEIDPDLIEHIYDY